MSNAAAPPALAGQPSRRVGVGRALLLVLGSLSILAAFGLFAAGGAAAWGLGQRDGSGFFTSGTHRLSTGSYALTSDSLEVGSDVPGWVFDDHFAAVRIEATSSRPVFLGVGRTDAVERYLRGVRHDRIRDLDLDPFSVSYRRVAGDGAPAPPASQGFWRVKASGPGAQSINWPLEGGKWSAVAMNADGSPGVNVAASFGARVPYLRWATIGLLAGGGLVLLLGASLVYLGARRPRAAVTEA